MDEEDLAQSGCDGLDPLEQLVLVGVAAEFVEAGDFGLDADGLAEDTYFWPLFDELAAQRVGRLEAGDQDGVARVLDVVAQVV